MGESMGSLLIGQFWGDGNTRMFIMRPDVQAEPNFVMEGDVAWPLSRHSLDTGFRWSFDAASRALVVDAEQAAPADRESIQLWGREDR